MKINKEEIKITVRHGPKPREFTEIELNKIKELFYSTITLKDIAKQFKTDQKKIRIIWKEEFGTTARKLKINNYSLLSAEEIEKIKEFFDTDIAITFLEKQLGIDQRKIRSIWRDTFGTSERKVANNDPKKISKEIINEIVELVLQGVATSVIAKKLGIAKGTVKKYVSKEHGLFEILTKNNKEKSREFLTKLRSKDKLTVEQKENVRQYFETDLLAKDIATLVGLSQNSIRNIFRELFGLEKYNERIKRLEPIRMKKMFESLDIAGKGGSKPERMFYDILNSCLDVEVIHHDFNIMPPFEIDITIPDFKLAICWDGIGHFKPIFGENNFKIVTYRDEQKRRYLSSIGWKVINIKDLNSKIKMEFMLEQKQLVLDEIIKLGYGEFIIND